MRRMIAAGPPAKRPPHIRIGCCRLSAAPCRSGAARRRSAPLLLRAPLALSAAAAADDGKSLRLGRVYPGRRRRSQRREVAFTDAEGRPASLADFAGKPVAGQFVGDLVPALPQGDAVARAPAGEARRAADRRGGVAGPRRRARPSTRFVAKLGLTEAQDLSRPEERRRPGLRGARAADQHRARRDGRVVGRVEGAAEWDAAKMLAVLEPLAGRDRRRLPRTAADQGARPAEHVAQETAAALAAPPDRSSARSPGRPASRPARRRACSAASACAIDSNGTSGSSVPCTSSTGGRERNSPAKQFGGDQPAGIAENAGKRPRAAQADEQRHHRALREADQRGVALGQAALLQFLVDIGVEDRRGGAHPGQHGRRGAVLHAEPLIAVGRHVARERRVRRDELGIGQQPRPNIAASPIRSLPSAPSPCSRITSLRGLPPASGGRDGPESEPSIGAVFQWQARLLDEA